MAGNGDCFKHASSVYKWRRKPWKGTTNNWTTQTALEIRRKYGLKPLKPGETKICIIGHSFIAHLYDNLREEQKTPSIQDNIGVLLNISDVKLRPAMYGRRGAKIGHLHRFKKFILREEPAILVVDIGSNDIASSNEDVHSLVLRLVTQMNTWLENFQSVKLIALCNITHKTKIKWSPKTVESFNKDVDNYNAILAWELRSHKRLIWWRHRGLNHSKTKETIDGTHFDTRSGRWKYRRSVSKICKWALLNLNKIEQTGEKARYSRIGRTKCRARKRLRLRRQKEKMMEDSQNTQDLIDQGIKVVKAVPNRTRRGKKKPKGHKIPIATLSSNTHHYRGNSNMESDNYPSSPTMPPLEELDEQYNDHSNMIYLSPTNELVDRDDILNLSASNSEELDQDMEPSLGRRDDPVTTEQVLTVNPPEQLSISINDNKKVDELKNVSAGSVDMPELEVLAEEPSEEPSEGTQYEDMPELEDIGSGQDEVLDVNTYNIEELDMDLLNSHSVTDLVTVNSDQNKMMDEQKTSTVEKTSKDSADIILISDEEIDIGMLPQERMMQAEMEMENESEASLKKDLTMMESTFCILHTVQNSRESH